MLGKGVCPYKYMDVWWKSNETSLSEKESFYRHLNMEEFTDGDYTDTKNICKDFEIKI